jgi:hypothetical protein
MSYAALNRLYDIVFLILGLTYAWATEVCSVGANSFALPVYLGLPRVE